MEFSLGEENSYSICSTCSSSDSTLSSDSGLVGTRSEMFEVGSIDTSSIIDVPLGLESQVHDQVKTRMENNTIP